MADIPEDVKRFKRAELQALCKKYGIKANMKNVEMIDALDEYRTNWMNSNKLNENDSNISNGISAKTSPDPIKPDPIEPESETKPIKSLPKHLLEPVSELDPVKVELMSELAKTESVLESDPVKSLPKPDPLPTNVSMEAEELVHHDLVQSPDSTQPDPVLINKSTQDPMEPVPDPVVSSQDDIQVAVEVNSSSQQPTTTTTTTDKPIINEKANNISLDMHFETDIHVNESIKIRQISVSPIKENKQEHEPEEPHSTVSDSTSANNEDTVEKVPTSTSQEEEKEEKILNTTFTIESPEKDVCDPLAVLSESLTFHTPRNSPLQGAWALRDEGKDSFLTSKPIDGTYHKESGLSIVQKSSDLGASPSLLMKPQQSVADKENNDETTHESIMALLNKRVADKMADPNYVPPPPSKIPIPEKLKASKTAKKFNSIHQREFNKMTSISDVAERQKRKRPMEKDNDELPSLTSEKAQKRQKVEVHETNKKPIGRTLKTPGKTFKTPGTTGKKPTTSSLLSSKKKKIENRPPFRL